MWREPEKDIKYQTGDILEVTSTSEFIPPFIKHYGIVFMKNGEPWVSHSTLLKGPEIERKYDFLYGGNKWRQISRYFRDIETKKMTDQHIEEKSLELIEKSKKYNKHTWNFWDNNCQDWVRNICPDCRLGIDHRFAMILTVIALILIILLIIWASKRIIRIS